MLLFFFFWAPSNIFSEVFFHFYFFRKDVGSMLNIICDKMASEVEGGDGLRT